MEPTLKSILWGRCKGSVTKALHYCEDMMQNSELRAEYLGYHETLMGMRGSHI